MLHKIRVLPASLLFLLMTMVPFTASAVEWSSVEGLDIKLFYPGQISWEYVLTRGEHSGAPRFRGSKNCNQCHEDDEAKLAANILSNLAPKDVYGDPKRKPGTIDVNAKFAYDKENLYARLEWKPTGYVPGGEKLDPDFETKVTMMIGDRSVRLARRAGCWPLCHDNARNMASAKPDDDITKYLPVSRKSMTREGGGENYKPKERLEKILDNELYMEYWQARLNPGKAAVPASGYILDKRTEQDVTLVEADAKFENGKWVVVLSRPFNASGRGVKVMQPRGYYMLGFAIHESHAKGRHHYVSLEKMLTFKDRRDAHFVAQRQ
jgi:cytochrome c-type protein NapC